MRGASHPQPIPAQPANHGARIQPFAVHQPRTKEAAMVVVRNVFQLKFGKAKDAVALMKEGLAIQKRVTTDVEFSTRLLTDVTGPFYTLVLELTVPSIATFESYAPKLFGSKEWQ